MITAFIIWSAVAAIYIIIGILAWNRKEPVGFFTGAKPPKVTDVTGYNHSVALLWFVFSVLFEATGVPLLFIIQNDPRIFIMIVLDMFLVIITMIAYMKIEAKYRAS